MRFCKLVLLTSIAAATATAALAAEQPADTAPPAASGGAPFSWTGAYVGLNAGGVFDGQTRFDRTTGVLANNTDALTAGLRPIGHHIHDSGFTGGAQLGYNYQFGGLGGSTGAGLLAGAEADIAYTDLDVTETTSNTTTFGALVVPGTTPTTRVNQYRGKLDYLGTVRGRLGLVYDQLLIYATGGFAYGHVKNSIVYYGPNAPTTPFFQGSESGVKTGYSYGAGFEYAVPTSSFLNRLNFIHSSAVTLKAEYIHYDLGRDTLRFPGVNGGATIGGYTSRVKTEGDLGRVGINYKF